MKIDELDLSYSGLVDLIQSDRVVANTVLKCIVQAAQDKKKEIQMLEDKAKSEATNLNYYLCGIEKICKHIGYKMPLNFVFDERIYAVNEKFEIRDFEITNSVI